MDGLIEDRYRSLWNHKLGLRNRRCGWGRSCNRWGDSRRKRILESGKDKWIRNWYRNCKITERRLKVHLPNWINQSQVRKSGQRKRTTMETWGVLTSTLFGPCLQRRSKVLCICLRREWRKSTCGVERLVYQWSYNRVNQYGGNGRIVQGPLKWRCIGAVHEAYRVRTQHL